MEDHYSDSADLKFASEGFARLLPKLQSLRLSGDYKHSTVNSVLDHCRAGSRRLYLPRAERHMNYYHEPDSPAFANANFIRILQQKCPVLKELGIFMGQSQGDAHEIALYQSLGGLPNLRKCHLDIYLSSEITIDFDLDGEHFSPASGNPQLDIEVASAIIDMVTDERLASSIFRDISFSKPLGAPPLDRLELLVDADRETSPSSSTMKIFRHFGSSWVCTRKLRDDRQYECFVEEYEPDQLLCEREAMPKVELFEILNGPLAPAFRRVWPSRPEFKWPHY
jgi:hypothetical protein